MSGKQGTQRRPRNGVAEKPRPSARRNAWHDQQSTAEQLACDLRDRILRGELSPGAPLREEALAETAGVSRHTIRAAIQALVHQGLADRQLHKGAAVKCLTAQDAREIYGVRRVLETAAVEAGGTCTAADFAPLWESLAQLESALADRSAEHLVEADLLFHRRLVALTRNSRLVEFFALIEGELRLGMSLVTFADQEVEDSPEFLSVAHRRIVELLTDGRVEECRTAVVEHLAYYEERLAGLLAAIG